MTGDKLELKGPDGTVISIRTELPPGGPHKYDYNYVGPEGGGHLITGQISGEVLLSDGSVYDIGPDFIPHLPGHAGPIMHHIDRMQERLGGIPVGAEMARVAFTHVCTDVCGAEKDAA